MPESFYDTVVILFFTVLPITLILLQIFLSSRKKTVLGFVLPLLWTALGIWIISAGRKDTSSFTTELLIFFAAGDIILIGIMLLVKYLKKRRSRR